MATAIAASEPCPTNASGAAIADMGRVLASLGAALADGRVSPEEARIALLDVARMQERLPDLVRALTRRALQRTAL